ncbi:Heterokaryon incompatibility protein (HET) domain containing protein [Naviculisporaceae sp. PSN 640]
MPTSPPSERNIFTTPENDLFHCKRKYLSLDPEKQEIRLLRVHPEKLTADNLASVFPQWLEGDTDAARLVKNNEANSLSPEPFICCQLLEAICINLRSGEYTALSYCAGNPYRTRRVMIDGYWFNAFENLEHALEGFRINYDKESWFGNEIWTDQVCINQLDFREKSHQVGMMRNIYNNAGRTCVVLSSPEYPIPDAHRGISALRTVSECGDSFSSSPSDLPPNLVGYASLPNGTTSFILDSLYKNPDKSFLGILAQLLKLMDSILASRWWTRAWVFQEFVVSKSVYFVCETESVALEELLYPLLFYLDYILYLDGALTKTQPMWPPQHNPEATEVIEALRISVARIQHLGYRSTLPYFFISGRSYMDQWFSHPRQPHFLTPLLVAERAGFEATDPRDALYAFCGLSRITCKVVVDYSPENTLWNVYINVSEHLIEAYKVWEEDENQPREAGVDLAVLFRAVHSKQHGNRCTDSLLPSWAPDFGSKEARQKPHHFGWQVEPWKLSDSSCTHTLVQDVSRSKWKILCVDGRRFARVNDLELYWWEPNGVRGDLIEVEEHLVLLHGTIQVDDELWVIHGGLGIHVLRRRIEGGYRLVGVGELVGLKPDSDIVAEVDYVKECTVIEGILGRGGDEVTGVQRIEIF